MFSQLCFTKTLQLSLVKENDYIRSAVVALLESPSCWKHEEARGKRNIRKPQELSDKIFADITYADVLPAHRETNMR